MFNEKKVLVTGGAGFIGSNLVKELVKQKAHVTVIDDLSVEGGVDYRSYKKSKVEFICAEIDNMSYNILVKLFKETEFIFHLASKVIAQSVDNPIQDFTGTFLPLFMLLNHCKEHAPKLSRLVFSSSSSVYGNASRFPIPEDAPFRPLTAYAASKIAAEMYCRAYWESYRVPVTVVRYSNVYGPGQSPENPNCGMVPKFIDMSLKGEPMRINGDGSQTRDFTYVGDAVEATLIAAESDAAIGEVFNIGTGIETSVNKMAGLIRKLTGSKLIPTHFTPRIILDDIDRRVVCIEKARKILGWTPKISLEEGLTETINWFRTLGG